MISLRAVWKTCSIDVHLLANTWAKIFNWNSDRQVYAQLESVTLSQVKGESDYLFYLPLK